MNAAGALRIAGRFGVNVEGARADEVPGGYSNEIWRVRGPDAAAVVRRYGRLHVGRATVAFEHLLLAHVAPRVPEVPAPLAARDGTTFALDEGAFVAVFPWIDGRTGARDAHAGAAAAALLARYHRAAADVPGRDAVRATRFLGALAWLREGYAACAAPDSPIARALPWTELIAALGASTVRVAAVRRDIPVLIAHGDPHPGNVVFSGGVARGLIDFDFAHETERVYDLGAFLDEFGRENDDAPLALERLPALVAAYASEAPLTLAERELIPDAMLRHAATLARYVVSRHGERSPGDVGGAPRYARRVIEIAAAVEAIRAAA